mmetsp:Transcript_28489/g.24378  ORF Transcript_28489/g.24378 Transcript_28489/m.24378 type:complete len:122 (+) Transcript_28489:70-435(+)
MRSFFLCLLGLVSANNSNSYGPSKTPDNEYYGQADDDPGGWCPMRQEAFAYWDGSTVCAKKCSSTAECPPASGGATGLVDCFAGHCFILCKDDSDCPHFPGAQAFCATNASPMPICFYKSS